MTQQQLSDKSGISSAVISHFETGVRANASADNLVKLADALRVSIDYLLGRSDEFGTIGGELDRKASELSDRKNEILNEFAEFLHRSEKREEGRKK